MPKNLELKKVLVIGSGPIIIGQAAEFDYAGTQACKALREEGVEVVLINSNPATIMTDENIADKVYIQPLTTDAIEYILKKEKPQGILPTLGGQTALNLAIELDEAGLLKKYKVKLLGTSLKTIIQAEDREGFKNLMQEIEEPIPKSTIVTTVEEAVTFSKEIGFPLIIRPAYTLGGTGGGIANNIKELQEFTFSGLLHSRIKQCLIEESLLGWKEIEYEVMRDANNTCITICNMENIDPVGIHTGDSIVVAPSQTLRDQEYHMLRSSATKIIKALKIEGGCNVQFALHPESMEYRIIEVNPRVSRSSALASKAAGYPIAKIAAKIAIGMHLHEIPNSVTSKTMASFEPALDYVVTKIPRWPFDKFDYADRKLGTQMKATGEVMAIDRSFEASFLKAVISIEGKYTGLRRPYLEALSLKEILKELDCVKDNRIFVVAEALRKGISIEAIHDKTKIDPWFLHKINAIIEMEKSLSKKLLDFDLLRKAEAMGFTDEEISCLSGKPSAYLNTLRRAHNIYPVYKMVDSCSAEFESSTPYYYSTFDDEDENIISKKEKIVVLGSGPIQIGQGIEFDYCSVHAAWAINEANYESIIINNNPETVSTDFDTVDKLYFEPLFIEDVANVLRKEVAKGVIIQFGGQTAINLGPKLKSMGFQVLGTSVDSINVAEDRELFESLLKALNIPQPVGIAVSSIAAAVEAAEKIGYPILARPSYVIGGRAMQIVNTQSELLAYIEEAASISPDYPILIDKYIEGKEVEVDAISDGEDILIPGIMEHIEKTGVHSGDSICVYPTQTLDANTLNTLVEHTKKLAKALQIVGLMNIQFVIDKNNKVYVIEVNPRASRTVPILSKVTKIPMIKIGINAILGEKLKDQGYGTGLLEEKGIIAVKVPVFSFQKLSNVDVALTPEMKSTGEVLGVDNQYDLALAKAFIGAGYTFDIPGKIYVSLNEKDKLIAIPLLKELQAKGYQFFASPGTAETCIKNGIALEQLSKDKIDTIKEKMQQGEISMVINTPTHAKDPKRYGFQIRTAAHHYKKPIFSCLDTVKAFFIAKEVIDQQYDTLIYETIDFYMNKTNKIQMV